MELDEEMKAALADVYERAAEYLEEHGWLQGDMRDLDGSACMAGACNWVTTSDTYSLAASLIADSLRLEGNNPTHAIGLWNDDPARTADEVINTLHSLANKLR